VATSADAMTIANKQSELVFILISLLNVCEQNSNVGIVRSCGLAEMASIHSSFV
jgi:hypothetical protein